jgi:hypothetical protein
MDSSLLLEGEGLIAVGRRAKERTDLIEQATEARSRAAMSEPAHRSIPLLDAAMILLQMVIQVAIGPVDDLLPEHCADRSWIGVMPIGRDPGRPHTRHGPRGAEECFSRGEVPCGT